MTHIEKCVELCKDGDWHCQKEFRQFSWSPHKRRSDATHLGYVFEDRKCEHGVRNSRDYRLLNYEEARPRKQVVTMVERDGQLVAQVSYV